MVCENCAAVSGWVGSCRRAYSDASARIVGDANASITATVADAPAWPAATVDEMPYAARSWGGVYPHGAYGSGFAKPPPYAASVVSTFSPQYAEQGCALRKPSEGGATAREFA